MLLGKHQCGGFIEGESSPEPGGIAARHVDALASRLGGVLDEDRQGVRGGDKSIRYRILDSPRAGELALELCQMVGRSLACFQKA